MTISTELRKAGPFTGNGATTAFPFSFKVFAASDVAVTRADPLGAETALVLNSDFTVALNPDQDAAPGGTVTLAAPLATGHRLAVTSVVPNLQPTDITNNGGFYPRVIEDALDRHVAQIQQIDEKVDRALKVAITSTLGDQALPSPVAGMLIGWNESNDGLKNYAPIGGTLLGQQLAAAYGSSLVGFQQAGTGAIVRTAQDKMREWVSVKDFGSVGDGSADDTAAIQAALTAHDHVLFPAGDYKISGTISLKSGNVLLGAGYSNTRIFRDTTVTPFDYFEGITVSGVKVSGIHFDGVAKLGVTVAANRYCALRFWDNGTGTRASDVVVEDCKFTYFTSAETQPEGDRGVIAVNNCDNVVVRGCWFEDNRATCIFYLTATQNIRILDNHCIGEQLPYDPVYVPPGSTGGFGSFCSGGSQGALITGNRIHGTGFTSINCGGLGVVVSNNVIRSPFYSAITINELSSNPTRDVVIMGNSIRDTGLSAISVFNVEGFVIEGNNIVGASGGGGGNGQIRLYPTSDGLFWPKNGKISSNYLAGGLNPGIRVNAASNIQIDGNLLLGCGQGIVIVTTNASIAAEIDITGNLFRDNEFYAIEFLAGAGAAQVANIDRNTIVSSNIGTKQSTGIVVSGANSVVRLGSNTFSSNYDTRLIETVFASRATKAVLLLAGGTASRMPLMDTINYTAEAVFDPPSIAIGSGVTTTISVAGAVVGDIVDVAFSQPLVGVQLWGWVSGPNVVSVRFHNQTSAAVDLASGTLTVRVRKV